MMRRGKYAILLIKITISLQESESVNQEPGEELIIEKLK
jgi:hypothetical protein